MSLRWNPKRYDDLNDAERKEMLTKATAWQTKHNEHVKRLIKEADTSYPPSGSDMFHPELWKRAHWKWFAQ